MKLQISNDLREEVIAYKKQLRADLTRYEASAGKAPVVLEDLETKEAELAKEIAKMEGSARHDDDKAVLRLMELKTRHGLITVQIGKASRTVEALSEPPMCGGSDLLMRVYQECFRALDTILTEAMLPFSRTRRDAQNLAHQSNAWGQLWAFGNFARSLDRQPLSQSVVERIEKTMDRVLAGEICIDFAPASETAAADQEQAA